MRIYRQDIGMECGIDPCAIQILGDIGSWHHQTTGNERKKKIKKSISEEPENYSRQNTIAGTLSIE